METLVVGSTITIGTETYTIEKICEVRGAFAKKFGWTQELWVRDSKKNFGIAQYQPSTGTAKTPEMLKGR